MKKYLFKDIVVGKDGLLKGPFGSDLKRELYVQKSKKTYKVYLQENILKKSNEVGNHYISPQYYESKMKRYSVKNGDFIVTCDGTLGEIYQLKNLSEKGIISSSLLRITLNNELVNDDYFYYYFKYYIKKELIKSGNNSVLKHLPNIGVIKNLELSFPSMEEQEKIANILSTIDSKIENSNKIIQELENMAKDIYNYWFLQFDFPNEEGKPYKSSGGKMVWNDELKKEIPEGWEVKKIGDCIEHINTGLNPRQNFKLNNGDIKYVTVKNINSNGTLSFESCDTIDNNAKNTVHDRSQIEVGDILFASIAPLGRCYIIKEEPKTWDINESVFSIRPNYDIISSEYLYLYFMSESFIKLAENSSTGSVFSGIRMETLKNIGIILPNKKINIKFSDKINNLFSLKQNLVKESENETAEKFHKKYCKLFQYFFIYDIIYI